MKNIKSRTFALELYPEDSSHMNILEYIIKYFNYAFILHDSDYFDKDIIDDSGKIIHKSGELKKEHYHVIISFYNARSIKKVLEELNQVGTLNHIETCNFYAYVRYLTHIDYPLKHQYNFDDIVSNIYDRVKNAYKRDYNSSEQDSRILLDFIFKNSNSSFLSFKQLTEFALENDCLNELKRNTYFYSKFIDDTNFRRF